MCSLGNGSTITEENIMSKKTDSGYRKFMSLKKNRQSAAEAFDACVTLWEEAKQRFNLSNQEIEIRIAVGDDRKAFKNVETVVETTWKLLKT